MWGGEPRGSRALQRRVADGDPRSRFGSQSGQRESNPHTQLGRLRSYRWTMSANVPLVLSVGTTRAVEPARIELAFPGCKPGALPLSYDPERHAVEPAG